MIDMTELADVVQDFAEAAPLTVLQPDAATQNSFGMVSTGSLTPVTDVVGSTWPINGYDISQMEDGKRYKGGRHIYTVGDVLRVASEDAGANGTNGSIVVVDGRQFEVTRREDWQGGGFSKYMAVVVKRNQGI